MAQGTTSIGTKLYENTILDTDSKATAGFKHLVGVLSTSAKGSEREEIENTELDEGRRSNLPGLEDSPNQTYTFNHTPENFAKVIAVCDKRHAFLEVYSSGDGWVTIGNGNAFSGGLSGAGTLLEDTLSITAEDIYYVTAEQVTTLLGA